MNWIPFILEGLGVSLAMMSGLWILSVLKRDASIVDPFWGPGFALLAGYYLWRVGWQEHPRGWLVAAAVALWGGRLGLHLLIRNWGSEEDYRYTEMREARGDAFVWQSLFVVFWLQAGLLWFIALPVAHAIHSDRAAPLSWLDALGFAIFLVGLMIEATADWQLTRFKQDPANKGKLLDSGLWRYSRHPNYFGDAVVWWGLFLIAAGVSNGWIWIASPIAMTVLLLKVSGVSLLEKRLENAKPGYREYIRKTSAFVLWFPRA